MNGQEIISIIVTAIVGFIFGIYIFWSGWLDTFGAPDIPNQAELASFSLVSEVYGSCEDACPSFRVLADGSYRYLFTPAIGSEQIIRDGNIPRSLRRDLLAVMDKQMLEAQSRAIEPSFCNSYTDGIDVRYTVTLNGEEFVIDSCGTTINTDSRLWNTLVKTWNYFETGEV